MDGLSVQCRDAAAAKINMCIFSIYLLLLHMHTHTYYDIVNRDLHEDVRNNVIDRLVKIMFLDDDARARCIITSTTLCPKL